MKNYFGAKFYSKHLDCDCVVLKVNNNNNWFFATEKNPTNVVRAQVKLSSFFDEEEK